MIKHDTLELQKVSEPVNYVPRKFSALAENFSVEVCPNRGNWFSLCNFFETEKTYILFFTIDHNPSKNAGLQASARASGTSKFSRSFKDSSNKP